MNPFLKHPVTKGLQFLSIFLFLSLWGCESKNDQKRFRLLSSAASGIDFQNNVAHLSDQNIIEYLYHYNGGGVAVGDINNDGLEDIYLSANQGSDQLYLNKGRLKFSNITESAGIKDTEGWSTGVTMADINADGWLDIYVCQVGDYKSYQGNNKLFINNQDGTFSEQSQQFGLSFTGFFTQAAFLDYDRDGDLDVFLMNHAVHTPRSYRPVDQYLPRDFASGDYLLKNEIDSLGVFVDVTEEAGIIANVRGYGLGLAVADINGDGWSDIYVGNDFHENDYLYINNRDGTFSEQLTQMMPHTSQFSMGVDVQDINNDGLMDVFTADMMPKDRSIRMKSGGEDPYKLKEAKFSFGFHPQISRNTLQLNKGDGRFADIASMSGLFATDWSWSVLMDDLDNNGWTDIFISNGIYKRPNDLDYINFLSNYDLSKYAESQQDSIEQLLIEKMPTLKIPNAIFSQSSLLDFTEVAREWGLDQAGYSGATASADFDLDGDLDLIVNNINQAAWLIENRTNEDSSRHHLTVEIKDQKGVTPIGAKLAVYADGQSWHRHVSPTRGFQASGSHLIHFGFGDVSNLDSLVIIYGDRHMRLEDVAVNQILKLEIDDWNMIQTNRTVTIEKAFDVVGGRVEVPANKYLDYNYEPLIPYRLSMHRTASGVADFDNDGTNEIFIGGTSGVAAAIYRLAGDGELIKSESPTAFEIDAYYEDASCAIADFNGDGLLDIYVASGGNRHPERSARLEDRLYLGNGKLGFERSDLTLPTTNASVAIAEDYDQDGDQDLFVGTLNVPGAYGFSSPSFVLENDGNANLKVVYAADMGMVMDARWFKDSENSKPRLVTVGEWEPLKIWEITTNGIELSPSSKAFEQTKGWYRSVEVADLNQDGTPDFLFGNLGLNSTLTASTDYPVKLYLDDFDKNGQTDPIISFYLDGKEIPIASKDMLTGQLPVLKKQYVSYQKYAAVGTMHELLGELYNPEQTIVKEAVELRHMLALSSDTGYQMMPLPQELQMSPINVMLVKDFNNDGVSDLLTGGNLMDHFSILGQLDANGISLSYGVLQGNAYHLSHQFFLEKEVQQIVGLVPVDDGKIVAIPKEGEVYFIVRKP